MKFKTYSFRFAEQVLNSNVDLKNEILDIITNLKPKSDDLTKTNLNKLYHNEFSLMKWKDGPTIFDAKEDSEEKLNFIKNRVGVEVQFGKPSFIGIDLLKFQTLSYSNPKLDKIDIGVYIVTTRDYQKQLVKQGLKWEDSISFERVINYLTCFKNIIQIPIYVIGLHG